MAESITRREVFARGGRSLAGLALAGAAAAAVAPPPVLAAVADLERRLARLRAIDAECDRLVEAGDDRAVRAFESSHFDPAAESLARAEDALCDALRAAGLAGVVVDGRLWLNPAGGVDADSRQQLLFRAEGFDLSRIAGLGPGGVR